MSVYWNVSRDRRKYRLKHVNQRKKLQEIYFQSTKNGQILFRRLILLFSLFLPMRSIVSLFYHIAFVLFGLVYSNRSSSWVEKKSSSESKNERERATYIDVQQKTFRQETQFDRFIQSHCIVCHLNGFYCDTNGMETRALDTNFNKSNWIEIKKLVTNYQKKKIYGGFSVDVYCFEFILGNVR